MTAFYQESLSDSSKIVENFVEEYFPTEEPDTVTEDELEDGDLVAAANHIDGIGVVGVEFGIYNPHDSHSFYARGRIRVYPREDNGDRVHIVGYAEKKSEEYGLADRSLEVTDTEVNYTNTGNTPYFFDENHHSRFTDADFEGREFTPERKRGESVSLSVSRGFRHDRIIKPEEEQRETLEDLVEIMNGELETSVYWEDVH